MRAESSLQDLSGLKSREWEAFEKAGFHTGQELLDWLPKRYEAVSYTHLTLPTMFEV